MSQKINKQKKSRRNATARKNVKWIVMEIRKMLDRCPVNIMQTKFMEEGYE